MSEFSLSWPDSDSILSVHILHVHPTWRLPGGLAGCAALCLGSLTSSLIHQGGYISALQSVMEAALLSSSLPPALRTHKAAN